MAFKDRVVDIIIMDITRVAAEVEGEGEEAEGLTTSVTTNSEIPQIILKRLALPHNQAKFKVCYLLDIKSGLDVLASKFT